MRRLALFLAMIGVCVLPACSKKTDSTSNAPRTLTQAQRDSAIAVSQLPGAGVVGKALEVADSADSRANQPTP